MSKLCVIQTNALATFDLTTQAATRTDSSKNYTIGIKLYQKVQFDKHIVNSASCMPIQLSTNCTEHWEDIVKMCHRLYTAIQTRLQSYTL